MRVGNASQVMVKLVKNHAGIIKRFAAPHMNSLALTHVAASHPLIAFRHTNPQSWRRNTIMFA